ncbi:MAG: M20/M25/M40 family metallo-hydrolase [Nitriliruptorales bacterium]|nr:M20/M25/M40 family metallo-hydrolase [Nitriliruptorales bacterium]
MKTPPASTPESLRDVAEALVDALPTTQRDLVDLVRIPSVSAAGHDPAPVRASAERTRDLLASAGLDNVRLLEVDGAHPYVFGERIIDPDGLTVLLYAHHDVQPVGTPDRWTSDPFEPTERDGRLYARGAADDKAGIMAHVAALRAWEAARGGPPCNVKVIVEGEEEIGSPHLAAFLAEHADTLRSDVIVLTDLTNWQVGWPGLTWALRGMGECFVTVRTLDRPVHSGMWGGPIPDALTAMTRLLASLHHADGTIAVDGFARDVRPMSAEERARLEELDADVARMREEAGVLDTVQLIGDDRTLLEKIWLQPTITPTGMDVPDIAHASNTLLAEVSTKLSCRFAPGQDPERALGALREHLEQHVPWGAEIDVRFGEWNAAWVGEPSGPAWDAAVAAMAAAYGREPAALGCGGSIPFVQPFSDAFGGAPCLLVGVEDPQSNAHGEDESLHLEDFARACLSEAFLLAELTERMG